MEITGKRNTLTAQDMKQHTPKTPQKHEGTQFSPTAVNHVHTKKKSRSHMENAPRIYETRISHTTHTNPHNEAH